MFAAHDDDQEETVKDFTVEPNVSSGSNKNKNSNKKVTTVVETDEIIHSVVQVEVYVTNFSILFKSLNK